MKERIQKVLAAAGVASRRHVEEMVLQGRVSVNGRVVAELPVMVNPETDRIEVDGERIRLGEPRTEQRYYVLLNKPKGIYSTNVAQGEQKRAIDLLPPELDARLYPVGRLDADSKGLLLLTNDGELTNLLTHPRYGVPKTYRVEVDGYVDEEAIDSLSRGVWLADKEGRGFRTGRSHIRVSHRSRQETVLEITLREGRNREVRRMLVKMGYKVRDLMRVKMGPLTLHGLGPGQSRLLTPREVRELRASVKGERARGVGGSSEAESRSEGRGGERQAGGKRPAGARTFPPSVAKRRGKPASGAPDPGMRRGGGARGGSRRAETGFGSRPRKPGGRPGGGRAPRRP